MSYGRGRKLPRVYLWRLTNQVGSKQAVCWKIGITGGLPEERLAAWSGWLAQAGLLTRVALAEVGFPGATGWLVEIVSVSPVMPWSSAVTLERSLHQKYDALALGNEFYLTHPDFGPGLLAEYSSAQLTLSMERG